MLRGLALCVALLAGQPVPVQAQAEPGIVGRWRDSDGESEIAIDRCGEALCGSIVWLKEPRIDRFNPDASLRGRSLLGLRVLADFRPDGEGRFAGSGYNPADGNTYRTTFALDAQGRLVIRGCALAGLLCDDDVWTRQK